jgi:hypothetical protein
MVKEYVVECRMCDKSYSNKVRRIAIDEMTKHCRKEHSKVEYCVKEVE